jgi:hypothetical protein
VALALALSTTLPLAAQTSKIFREGNSWVEEITGSLPRAATLRVRTPSGSVQIEGGGRDEITYTIRKRAYIPSEADARAPQLRAFRVSASGRGRVATVQGKWEGAVPPKFFTEFHLRVPRELALAQVNTDSGNVSIAEIAGRVEARSGGGGMRLMKIAGPVKAELGGGGLEAANISGELTLVAGGGPIRIMGSNGPIRAQSAGGSIFVASSRGGTLATAGGSIQISHSDTDLRASTAGGSIDVGRVRGAAALESSGGSIRVGGAQGPVRATTGAGSIQLFKLMQGAWAQTGAGSIVAEFMGRSLTESHLESADGDILVYLPPEIAATVRASIHRAEGYNIHSEFPEVKVDTEKSYWGGRNLYAEGTLNGGGPMLKVSTISGNIQFRRTGSKEGK